MYLFSLIFLYSRTAPALLRYVHGGYFNSHAHVERDKTKSKTFPGIAHFNSHAHVERDDRMLERRKQLGNFNSHAHVERDRMG